METRGRKPLPEEQRKPPQATVKINNFILPFVKELKGNLKKELITDSTMSQLFDVLQSKSEHQASVLSNPDAINIGKPLKQDIAQLKSELSIKDNQIVSLKDSLKAKIVAPIKENERGKLKKQYNDEHSKAIQLEGKVRSLESDIRRLKLDYDELLHREHDCMSIKANGERCAKTAVIDVIQDRVNLHVCLQHFKILSNKVEQ